MSAHKSGDRGNLAGDLSYEHCWDEDVKGESECHRTGGDNDTAAMTRLGQRAQVAEMW